MGCGYITGLGRQSLARAEAESFANKRIKI